MNNIKKYPRTRHIVGSNLQAGDEDLTQIPFSQLIGKHVVVEEKVDGSNCAISYDNEWNQLLQSRGHYLTGGPREKEFNVLKQWASVHSEKFLEVLTDRYIMYGENMYAKHTEFYDRLTHYFMEFDILDTQNGTYIDGERKEQQGSWLSTPRRKELLKGLPVEPVLVLFEGKLDSIEQLKSFVTPSHFKSENHWNVFMSHFPKYDSDSDRAIRGTDPINLMEGLYLKVEEDGVVKERYKWVRGDFLQCILNSDGHWHERPIIPNILADGIDIFAEQL